MPKKPPNGAYCPKCGYFVGGYVCKCWRRKKGPSVVVRLVDKLRSYGHPIPDEWQFERLRPGRHQRDAGAWSWRLSWCGGEIGSPDPAKSVLKATELHTGPFGTIYA